MKTQKTKSYWPGSQSTCIDSRTRRDIRRYTSQIFDTARELDTGLFRAQEKCLRALRAADLMEASRGLVPVASLARFHEVIADSVRVTTGATGIIRDLIKNTRMLAAMLYNLPDPFEANDEEAENN